MKRTIKITTFFGCMVCLMLIALKICSTALMPLEMESAKLDSLYYADIENAISSNGSPLLNLPSWATDIISIASFVVYIVIAIFTISMFAEGIKRARKSSSK